MIGNNAFEGCKNLTKVNIKNSVTTIGEMAFARCSALTEVTLPNSITSISDYAFQSCTSLQKVNLPNKIKTLERDIFANCSKLTNVDIPNSVTEIKDYAFQSCVSLTKVVIPSSVKKLGIGVFSNCTNLEIVEIPNTITEIPYGAFLADKSLKSVIIPESVKYIARTAFANCSSLESVTFPKSIERISSDAFDDCWNLVFYAYKESFPAIFANNFNINVVYLDGGNSKPNTSYKEDIKVVGMVSIEKNAGVSLEGTEIEKTSNTYTQMVEEAKKQGYTDVSCAYELKLKSGDVKNGLAITFNVGSDKNGKEAIVLHRKQDGTYEKFIRKVTNGKVVVTVTELSPFIVAFKGNGKKLDDEPTTGIEDYTIYTSVLAIISLGGIAIFNLRKIRK